MQRKNLKFIQGVDFDLIENLPNNGTGYLLIFDDSCEEISNSKQFVKIATAGRHRGLNTIYIIFPLVLVLNSMSWNIGFSRNLLLNLHNKLGLFHIVLEEKSQKLSLTIIKSQNLPNLQNLDVDSQISHFEWTLHNGRRKIHIRKRSDTKKIDLVEYRRNGNQWKKINLYNYKEKNMINYLICFLHY